MMNVISIALVLASLLTAQVLHPSSSNSQPDGQDVIFKEGHRVVVVETFDHEGHHNTKVSISPELKQESSDTIEESPDSTKESSDGVVCDALGKCTRKIGDAAERIKGRIFNAAGGKDLKDDNAYEAASKKTAEAKETMKTKAHDAKESMKGFAHDTKESMKGFAHDTKDGLGFVNEAISEKAEELKEKAKTKAHDAKESVKMFAHETQDELGLVNDAASRIRHNSKESAEELKEKAKSTTTMIKNTISDLGERAQRVVSHFIDDAVNLSMETINLFGSSIAYGVCIWVTFVSSHVLAGALPRQQFAVVQSKIYPVYFRTVACSIGAALLGQYLGHNNGVFSCFYLLVALVSTLFNGLILEPKATKVMFARMKLEKENARGVDDVAEEVTRNHEKDKGGKSRQRLDGEEELHRASERLKMLNLYSSLLNLMTLMSVTMHLGYLTRRLHAAS